MKRLMSAGSFLLAAGLLMLPAVASAQGAYDTNTGCGLGNKLFKNSGQDSVLLQVLAVTTNGSFGNQTFAISSGTLGCQRPSGVASNKVDRFVAENMDTLAQAIAIGRGEALVTLAELMEVSAPERDGFYVRLQAGFGEIFTSASVESHEVVANIYRVAKV